MCLYRGVLAVLMALAVTTGAGAQPSEPLSLPVVAQAYDRGDIAILKDALEDPVLMGELESLDPEAVIGVHLAVARKLDDAAAQPAYLRAIATIRRLKGQDDISLAEPFAELAAVQDRLGAKDEALASLRQAYEVMALAMGPDHELTAPYKASYEARLGRPAPAADQVRAGRRPPPKLPFHRVEIFYATHRVPTGAKTPATYFGGAAGPLRYGRAVVSLPNDRDVGEIPRASILALEFKPDPARHVILTSIKPYGDRAQFLSGVSARVAASRRKEVFVFIHGFNTSFQGAAERTAQLADDLSVDGAPILYSWPSKANPLAYRDDEREAVDAGQIADLAAFLADVAQRTGATRVNLVAHSMGNRFLTRALARLATRPASNRPNFQEIVMAAPDVGVDEFKGLWPRIRPMGRRFTVYASSRDRALELSGKINLMQRVGDARVKPTRGIETIDTTAASAGLLGHSDFAGTALDDFRGVIWASLTPDKRCVLASQGGGAWAFATGGCPATDFRSVLAYVRTSETPAAALLRVRAALASARPETRRRLERIEAQLTAINSVSGTARPR